MAAESYEDLCMRAELMGVSKPNYDEFLQRREEAEALAEKLEAERLKNAELQNEDLKATTSKFDELNGILAKTQRRINNLKYRCGSVSEMFRTKFGSPSKSKSAKASKQPIDVPADVPTATANVESESLPESAVKVTNVNSGDTPRKSDLERALDFNVDKLDALLDSAEKAQYSMSAQNKQMRKHLKK